MRVTGVVFVSFQFFTRRTGLRLARARAAFRAEASFFQALDVLTIILGHILGDAYHHAHVVWICKSIPRLGQVTLRMIETRWQRLVDDRLRPIPHLVQGAVTMAPDPAAEGEVGIRDFAISGGQGSVQVGLLVVFVEDLDGSSAGSSCIVYGAHFDCELEHSWSRLSLTQRPKIELGFRRVYDDSQ